MIIFHAFNIVNFNNMDTENVLYKEIDIIDFKLHSIQTMAEDMAKDMGDSLDIDLVLKFIKIKDIKKAKKTSVKLYNLFEEVDVIGIMKFSINNTDSSINFCIDKMNPSEGLCFLGMYSSLLIERRKTINEKIKQVSKV